MIRVAVVDDDQSMQQLIDRYLKKYGSENGQEFAVSFFSDGSDIAARYEAKFDIIFLDVQMGSMDGLSAARQIRKLDRDVAIIFITNMAQYAIKGYEVDAMSYLLKPVPYFPFSQELHKCLQRIGKRKKTWLAVPLDDGVMRLDTEQIIYIESIKHRVVIYTEEGEYSMVATLRDLEGKLAASHFYRCNSGFLVNLAHVKGLQDGFVLAGKYRLQASRARKKGFLEALTDYLDGANL